MGTAQKEDQQPPLENHQGERSAASGLAGMIEEQYRKVRENAETYPYVWGSYIFVYGGIFLWTAYRWRRLRKTEDRIRGLQEKLRKLIENEKSRDLGKATDLSPPSAHKPTKLPTSAHEPTKLPHSAQELTK